MFQTTSQNNVFVKNEMKIKQNPCPNRVGAICDGVVRVILGYITIATGPHITTCESYTTIMAIFNSYVTNYQKCKPYEAFFHPEVENPKQLAVRQALRLRFSMT